MSAMKKMKADRRRLLAQQHEALRRLREEKGYSMSRIAAFAGVSERHARNWLGGQLARRHSRELLVRAAEDTTAAHVASPPARRGVLRNEDRALRDRLLLECDLKPARRRVRTLLGMIKDLKITREAFARLLEVHRTTLYDYLDPDNDLMPALQVVLRIKRLKQDLAKGHRPATLRERFHNAARVVFGDQLYAEGFAGHRELRPKMIAWLNQVSGLTERTLYRWLPPYEKGVSPPLRVVEAFELARSQRRSSPLRTSRRRT